MTFWTVLTGVMVGVIPAVALGWTLARLVNRRHEAARHSRVMQAVSSAEQRSAAILESTTDSVFEVDRDWRITFINGRARHLLAQGRDLTGSILWEEFPEARDTPLWSNYLRAITEQVPVEFEVFYAPLGGWYAVRAFPSSAGLAVYFQDVTERRRLTEELKRHEALLDRVLETLPVGVIILEADGMIRRANPAAQQIWGGLLAVGIDDFGQYRGWRDSTGERIEARDWAAARAITHGETVLNEVIAIEAFDGRRKTILNSALPVRDARGAIIGAVSVMEDVTERIQADQALRRAKEEADQALLSKSKFLAAASHDLRQPLQSLFLFSAALAPHVADERGRRALALLDRGLETLKALLDSLLDVSRLDAGVIDPQVGDAPLGPILDDIAAAYAPVAHAKGVAFEIEQSCRVVVHTDPMLLGRMIRNMAENAVRYTDHGGVRIGCAVTNGSVRIGVSDTGIGIPPEHLERIFDEFHQVGNLERDRSQGLGLGLAIVRRLSLILALPVHVTSESGRGSTFSIDVPLGEAKMEFSELPYSPGPAHALGLLALVVDDDVLVLTGLRAILEDWTYEVITAASGDEAVERVQNAGRPLDIVIADYRLRNGEVGPQVIQRLRDVARVSTPGIILTGETGPEHQEEAARHGFELVHKPLTPKQLHDVLERTLRVAR
ncbi:PAS domain-containing protein [Azospirillum brasilense]|uniref:PAS domain-containing hybrid sensor histidine kinase/response regulator n=1 Tax=Azospirillum argentinense TaxID=2970906 RepID=UPI00190B3E56|nr:ATP-binding protein [Azospirillum argentinense]MBK3800711.1 PAS domain-containing protein [Azospirillum argentinense]